MFISLKQTYISGGFDAIDGSVFCKRISSSSVRSRSKSNVNLLKLKQKKTQAVNDIRSLDAKALQPDTVVIQH